MTPEFRVDFTDGFNFKTVKRNLCAVICAARKFEFTN